MAPSCSYMGTTPSTALSLIQARGSSLGGTVVMDVGYNEDASGYAHDLDTIMSALVKAKVRRVIWVTLREERPTYSEINAVIRAAPARWSRLSVADWNAASSGRALVLRGRTAPERRRARWASPISCAPTSWTPCGRGGAPRAPRPRRARPAQGPARAARAASPRRPPSSAVNAASRTSPSARASDGEHDQGRVDGGHRDQVRLPGGGEGDGDREGADARRPRARRTARALSSGGRADARPRGAIRRTTAAQAAAQAVATR